MARDITRYERNLMKDMDHWFDSFFNTRKVPSVDIREGKDSYTVRASLAGMWKTIFSISREKRKRRIGKRTKRIRNTS